MTEQASQKTSPSVEDVIAGYINLRTKKQQLEAAHKTKIDDLNKRMAKLEAWLQVKMSVDKVNAFNTDAGSAYKTTVESATVSDMGALLDFIRKNEAWHLLEKRVSKLGIKSYLEDNQPIPPGVDWYTSTAINVRKPSDR